MMRLRLFSSNLLRHSCLDGMLRCTQPLKQYTRPTRWSGQSRFWALFPSSVATSRSQVLPSFLTSAVFPIRAPVSCRRRDTGYLALPSPGVSPTSHGVRTSTNHHGAGFNAASSFLSSSHKNTSHNGYCRSAKVCLHSSCVHVGCRRRERSWRLFDAVRRQLSSLSSASLLELYFQSQLWYIPAEHASNAHVCSEDALCINFGEH